MPPTASEIVRDLDHEPISLPVAFGVSLEGDSAQGAAGGARSDQIFRVASVTKPFVAALVLTLVQDGLLDLDALVTDYLPHLSLPAGPVTLRQLLSHQAALEHEWSTPLAEYGEGDDALDRLAAGAAVAAPVEPGRWFSYASAGFYVMAAVAQRVAGTTFEAAMKERVLDPLGLARTSFDGDASLDYPRARRGGGGLYSNVPDLLAFAEHLLGGPGPLARESLEAMATPQIAAPEGWYGLGIGLRDVGGRRILEHGGSVPGFKALFTIVPDCDLAFVALSSSDAGRKAIDRLRDRAFESGCGLVPQEPVRRPVDPAALAALTGSYDTHTFGVRLAPADGGLAVEIADADETVSAVAVPTGDSVFRVADGDEEGLLVELLEPGLVRVGGMVARRSG